MSSVPYLPMAERTLRTGRYVLLSVVLVTQLSGCALWYRLMTFGTDKATPTAQETAAPPSTPVTEEAPRPSMAPVPNNAVDTTPVEHPPVAAPTPLRAAPPADNAAQKVSPKGKGKATKAATTKASSELVRGFYINVGLFAVPSNGTNAFRTLEQAELPVFTDVIHSKKGALTRVRVGPYATKTEADAAAAKIKGLKLDAIVFEH